MRISALDHTLGHNPQRREVDFSVDARLAISRRLDRLGIDYLEAGCPSADPTAREFFARARTECHLWHGRLVASLGLDAIRGALDQDAGIGATLEAGTGVVAVSGCCWHAGPIGLQEYCGRIAKTVGCLKLGERRVIFRADDFFDGYRANPRVALNLLEAAKANGADVVCLCDSAGGSLPHVIREVCLEVRKRIEGVLGIRAHDDSGLAVANTLEAVEQGFTHIEGSISAYGTRGGNADLCSIIANLEYKLGHTVVGRDNLEGMPGVARFIVDAGAMPVRLKLVRDEEALLEEVDKRLSGRLTSVARRAALERIRLFESAGYELHTANGTLELLVREALSPERPFATERYELTCHATPYQEAMTTATARLRVGDAVRSESEQGAGPVDALARALRQCLFALYPAITEIRLRDYRVHTIEPAHGGASRVRVAIDWSESGKRWTTAGVSADLVEAAWLALVGGFQLALMRVAERGLATLPSVADMSWAV